MMRAALAFWAARSAPRMTKLLRPLAAMAMALPLARMARSTTLPLTISAFEFGNRALIVGGRPTWRAFAKSSAYAMEGLLQRLWIQLRVILSNPPRVRASRCRDRIEALRCRLVGART